MKTNHGIRSVGIETGNDGRITRLTASFGPHHYFTVSTTKKGRVRFRLCYKHHGFESDASEVNGDLEKIIETIRKAHPKTTVD
jgi:hypothetical protein